MQQIPVWLDVPLPEAFSYLHPHALASGTRVQVPFGNRLLCGLVDNDAVCKPVAADKLRAIDRVLDELPPLPEDWWQLVHFASQYYLHPFGQALFTALPTAMREAKPVRLPDRHYYRLNDVGLARPPAARAKVQLQLWQALHEPQSRSSLQQLHARGSAFLAERLAAGEIDMVEPERAAFEHAEGPPLNAQQAAAVAEVKAASQGFAPFVLYGITGSGKTEVYLQLIAEVLRAGRQALLIIPEINLTPQLLQRFNQRFHASRIVSLHSNLADGERLQAWHAAWQGEADIVIGTRLAVFTPLARPGLFIVDEEHDGSFKQADGLRYHARDLMVWRARQAQLPVVLGSATPSLESMANVAAGRYRLLRLDGRAHAAATLPEVGLVDTRRLALQEGLSPAVVQALGQGLQRGEMSLVYLNRRGYAPVLACTACAWTSACRHCTARMVLHLNERQLRCHHCGARERIPLQCPSCGNPDIHPLGEGTQRMEAALQRFFPSARILRIDRDSTSSKAAWDAIYQRVHAGEVDILLGTQMLAKGHDFARISLVVALGCDGGLYSADFRASERLFAQLLQVAGRAGRGELKGRVLVQTQFPEHPVYQHLQQHDFDGFAKSLLAERQEAGFPPAASQIMLRADAADGAQAMQFLQDVLQQSGEPGDGVTVFGPAPALMLRLAGRERVQLTYEAANRAALHRYLRSLLPLLPALARPYGKALRWSVDVDPMEF